MGDMKIKGRENVLGGRKVRSLAMLFCIILLTSPACGSDSLCRMDAQECGDSTVYGSDPLPVNGSDTKCICVAFFYSPTCGHCHAVDALLFGVI